MELVRDKIKDLKAYQVENPDECIKLHANENPYPPSPELLNKIFQRLDELELKDRKSTRLNSSHKPISYAVFCLKKKKHTP